MIDINIICKNCYHYIDDVYSSYIMCTINVQMVADISGIAYWFWQFYFIVCTIVL